MSASYAHLAPATLVLGGAATLALTASGELSTPGAQAASIAGGLALLTFLTFLWWANVRAARYAAWARSRYPAPTPRKGGFLVGAALGLCLAVVLHVGAYVVAKQEIGPEGLQFLGVVWTFTGFIGYAVLPLFVGWIGRLHRATSVPRS